MSNVQTQITITHNKETIQTIKDKLLRPASKPKEEAVNIMQFMNALAGMDRAGKLAVQVSSGDQAYATGTITFSSFANTNTITVGTQTLTMVASGASGNNQWNNASSDTANAAAAAALINAHPKLSQYVSATANSGIITITSLVGGDISNNIALAISAHGSVSASTLTSGANATTYSTLNTYHLGV
jgi:hypothetical protein